MVPQIRESAHCSGNSADEWRTALEPERQRLGHLKKFQNFHQSSYIVSERRKVLFDDQIDVYEVERIDEKYHKSLWFSESELDGFEKKYYERASRKHSAAEKDARAYNHVRRVVFHHKAYKQMGDYDMKKELDYLSSQSSQCSKDLSRKSATHVEKEVRKYYQEECSKRSSRRTSKQKQSGLDYYMSKLYDLYRQRP
eukprot:scaffold2189_cov116-Cylindrotheca_fusiformis.AAC.15